MSYVYKYEHTNGEIITKPAIVCESGTTPSEYFNSPFVKRWWKEEIVDEQEKRSEGSSGKGTTSTDNT